VSELMARLDRIESAMTMQVGRSEDVSDSPRSPLLPLINFHLIFLLLANVGLTHR